MDYPATLHIDGITDVGTLRQNNEDAWWGGRPGGEHCIVDGREAPLGLDLAEGPALLLVSDGMGGARAGEVASQMAVTLVVEALSTCTAMLKQVATARPVLLTAMREAHHAIVEKSSQRGFEGMGATLSLLSFTSDGSACWAQAGDSRIYVFREGHLRQISRDHSPVGRLRQQGRITEAEARKHPSRNLIDLSMGDRMNAFEPDSGVEEVFPGDVFLLCSDGLSDGLWDHEIEQGLMGLRRPEDVRDVLNDLIAGAKHASGRDNITAVAALAVPTEKSPGFWRRLFGR